MHIILILVLLSLSSLAAANTDIDWVRLGYIVVQAPDGSQISRHAEKKEALESAANHAFKSGNTGKLSYLLIYPDERIDITIPEVAETEPPAPPEPPYDDGSELDPNTVFFCDGGARGATVEPDGKDSNDGASPDTPYKSLTMLGKRPDGTDVRLCEGGVFHDQRLVVRHGGVLGDANRVVVAQ